MTPEEAAERELAKLDQRASEELGDMKFFTVRKLLLGVACGVAACALIVVILELNKPRPGRFAPAPAKPVAVQILPAKP